MSEFKLTVDFFRPSLSDALAQMCGKEIGVLPQSDGSARLQWPDEDGSLPGGMMRLKVTDAREEDGFIAMRLASAEVELTFCFSIEDIVLQ